MKKASSKGIRNLAVIANCSKPRAADTLKRLRAAAGRIGLRLLPEEQTAAAMGAASQGSFTELVRQSDALMVLGGDGTMLRAVRELDGHRIPVIGVNLGGLGFMTSVTENDLERALECLAGNEYSTSERSIVECVVTRSGKEIGRHRALNDIVLSSVGARVATLRMAVDDEAVGDFMCDGLIVSTPTGSTGHSLSAGGPVLMPEAQAFVVSLICPHTLSTRPLVLPDSVAITVCIGGRSGGGVLTADGQISQPLHTGDEVKVTRCRKGVRLIHLPGYSYFVLLRQKLHWRGSNV